MYYFGLTFLFSPVVKYMKTLTNALLIEPMQCNEFFFRASALKSKLGRLHHVRLKDITLGCQSHPRWDAGYLFRQVGGGLGITWEGFVKTGGHLTTSPHITESQIFVINKNTVNDDYSCKY